MRTLLTQHYDSVVAAGWPPLWRYGLALVCTAGAILLTALLPEIGTRTPFLLYVVAVAAACFYGGFGPGALAAVLGLLFAPGWQGAPGNVLPSANPFPLQTAGYVLISLTILLFNYALRGSRAAHRRQETALGYQEFLLANMSDAVFIIDLARRITHWNHGAEMLYGWQAAEVIGQLAPDVLRTEASTETIAERLAGVAEGTQNHFQAVHSSRTGELLYVESTATAIRNNGVLAGYLVINRNITERIRHEQELKQLNATLEQLNATLEQRVQERTAELERSNRELDQFAFVASHDLKAPLRAIASLASWITEDSGPALSAKSRIHLDKLNARVKRMERLLDDLLAYSRAGRALQPPEQVATGLLVQETVELLNLSPGFQVLLPPDMPVLVTERVPLTTVFRNLIQNAYKHHDHPDRGCVTISNKDLGDAVEFTVADDGPGIAPEYHDQVFELFRTLKPRDQVEGSGMGLSVVKKTVESRGGAIHLTSSPGHGAAFTFTWPRVG